MFRIISVCTSQHYGNITFQKNFGGASNKDVAIGSKHAGGGIISEYTDATRCQLAKAAKRQCDIRDKMIAVLAIVVIRAQVGPEHI